MKKNIKYPEAPYMAGEVSSRFEAYDEGYYFGFWDGKKAANSFELEKSKQTWED